jgi:hypothetical protein
MHMDVIDRNQVLAANGLPFVFDSLAATWPG